MALDALHRLSGPLNADVNRKFICDACTIQWLQVVQLPPQSNFGTPSSPFKDTLCPLIPLHSSSPAATSYFHYQLVCSGRFHGFIQCLRFCIWLLTLNVMYSKFTQTITCIGTTFILHQLVDV